MRPMLFVFIVQLLLYTTKSLPSEDITYNLRNINQECFDEGSQFWGSFWLFTDEGQIYFEMYPENIYFQTIFPDRYWLGISWNELCQECVIQNTNEYRILCKEACLNQVSFIVIGQHDLSTQEGWGFIDVDAAYNTSLSNYTLYNLKNTPHSYYNNDIDFTNVVFFKPHIMDDNHIEFNEYTTDNVWAVFQRLYDAPASDNWSRMYEIEVNTPSMPTCITYISSKGTNEHSSVSAKYTQTPEIIEYWDVVCVNVSEYCSAPTPAPTWQYIPPIDIGPYCKGKHLELVIFLDTSWSILEDVDTSWEYAKRFSADLIASAYDVVNNISNDVYTLKVSFITFSNNAELIYNLDEFGDEGINTNQDLLSAQNMILDVELPDIVFRNQMQGTHARDAIELYLDEVSPLISPEDAGLCLIMITDGRPDDPFLQSPCHSPALGGPIKRDGAIFTLLTVGDMDDLSFFRCLMDNPEQQAIQLDDTSDLFEITPLIENKLYSLVCAITNAICDYPLYSADFGDLNPIFPVQNKTIYDPEDGILINTIEYEFSIRDINSTTRTTDTYNGYVWIVQISISIYNLHFSNDISLSAYIVAVDTTILGVISNITEVDAVEGHYVYNISFPVIDPETDEEYRMIEDTTYRLGIRIDNIENCEIDEPDTVLHIPCAQYPNAPPFGKQQEQFSSWYYFDNVTVYYGDENIGPDTDLSLCVPLVQLCIIEPLVLPTFGPTAIPTSEPSDIPTADPTITPTEQPVPQPTLLPTEQPTIIPTEPTQIPTSQPTEIPTDQPTLYPTDAPTEGPTFSPTIEPSIYPTDSPTAGPTFSPTREPSLYPTYDPATPLPSYNPTVDPTQQPLEPGKTKDPTEDSTLTPSIDPTFVPTDIPTFIPIVQTTMDPTVNPTHTTAPTSEPTVDPTQQPLEPGVTRNPTQDPTTLPTINPTPTPSTDPTDVPSVFPTNNPTDDPSNDPTENPSFHPTHDPLPPGETREPTPNPTDFPTSDLTADPTTFPSTNPTFIPSPDPIEDTTFLPSEHPTTDPTQQPLDSGDTHAPTPKRTEIPTENPTDEPTGNPTFIPSPDPIVDVTFLPSEDPTTEPTEQPLDRGQTHAPTAQRTDPPTENPTNMPTDEPTANPSYLPTDEPTKVPSPLPTRKPFISGPTISHPPTVDPSFYPTEDPGYIMTQHPSEYPTSDPSFFPTEDPTQMTTQYPTEDPTTNPSFFPTEDPIHISTTNPTLEPSETPTILCEPYPITPPDAAKCPLLCDYADTEWDFIFSNWTFDRFTDGDGTVKYTTVYTYRLTTYCNDDMDVNDNIYECVAHNQSYILIDNNHAIGTKYVELFQYQDPCCYTFDMDIIAYSSHPFEVVYYEDEGRTSWRFWINVKQCQTEYIQIVFDDFVPPYLDFDYDQIPDQDNYGTFTISGKDHRCVWKNGIILPYPCKDEEPAAWPTPMPTKKIPWYSPRPIPRPGKSWWGKHQYDDDASTDLNDMTQICPREQAMPDEWRCFRECLDIRSTEWNVELAGITQNVDDGSSEWTYRIQVSELYLPDHYNHWCGYYGDLGSSFGPRLADINMFYIGVSACCDVPDGVIADATSFALSHPRIDGIEKGWIWEDLRITNRHFAEFTLVFSDSIYAPIHGEFWILSEDEARCVHGGTLVPDFCHFSQDYTLSGMLALIVVNDDSDYNDIEYDPCNELISYFDYDQSVVKCTSYPHDDIHRRMLKSDDGTKREISFNFTLIFSNDTAFGEAVKNIKNVIDDHYNDFGELFKRNFKTNANVTVLSISIGDLEYGSGVAVNISDSEIPKNEMIEVKDDWMRTMIMKVIGGIIFVISVWCIVVILSKDTESVQSMQDDCIVEGEVDDEDAHVQDSIRSINNMNNCF